MGHIVVTGAAGFIGSHLCERLLSDGHAVTGIDNFDSYYDEAVKRRNIECALSQERYTLLEGDIRSQSLMREVLGREVDAVVHLAARAGVRPSIEEPELYHDVNLTGTAVLLEAARRAGIRRLVFASSSSVYGNNRKVPFSEDDPVDHPISPYAATKKAGELTCHAYHHLYGMNIACLRLFTVYGPRQRPDLAIHKFARLIEAGEPIPVFGDGTTKRDYTYVDDIVAGILAAMDQVKGYRVYNLGNHDPVSLNDLIAVIGRSLGRVVQRRQLGPQAGDVDTTYADISRARKELGWYPRTGLAEGLERFKAWLRG